MTRILDVISRAEALRCGIPVPDGDTSSDAAAASSASEDDFVRRSLRDAPVRDGRDKAEVRRRRYRGLKAAKHKSASTANTAAFAGEKELNLLRQAVALEDALGYDEPPQLPVPTRLYLGAALLRGASWNDGVATLETTDLEAGAAVAAAAAVEAESTFRALEASYPGMGRTLLGLSRACSALGKNDESEDVRQQFLASWRHSEVWLDDSAHVGGHLYSDSGHHGHYDDVGPSASSAAAVGIAGTEQNESRGTVWVSSTTAVAVVIALSLAVIVVAKGVRGRGRGWRFMGVDTVARRPGRGSRGYRTIGETDLFVSGDRDVGRGSGVDGT